jgi:RNA 3'-terminal phosphate cyclase (ATP)
MIPIDGSEGEGGGQILRTSLALALVTGQPFRMERIRARRQKPGLLRQHLTAVEAARTVGSAEVRGTALSSQVLEFRPGPVTPGNYRFAVGTAGSGCRHELLADKNQTSGGRRNLTCLSLVELLAVAPSG